MHLFGSCTYCWDRPCLHMNTIYTNDLYYEHEATLLSHWLSCKTILSGGHPFFVCWELEFNDKMTAIYRFSIKSVFNLSQWHSETSDSEKNIYIFGTRTSHTSCVKIHILDMYLYKYGTRSSCGILFVFFFFKYATFYR